MTLMFNPWRSRLVQSTQKRIQTSASKNSRAAILQKSSHVYSTDRFNSPMPSPVVVHQKRHYGLPPMSRDFNVHKDTQEQFFWFIYFVTGISGAIVWLLVVNTKQSVALAREKEPPLMINQDLPTQLFSGRTAESGAVKNLLTKNHVAYVVGPSGIGKTQFLYKFGHDNKNDYALVAFVDGKSEKSLEQGLDSIIYQFYITPPVEFREKLEVLRKKMAGKKGLLLIDNLENQTLEHLNGLRKIFSGNLDIVIATKCPTLCPSKHFKPVHIGPLSDDDSNQILSKFSDNFPAQLCHSLHTLTMGIPGILVSLLNHVEATGGEIALDYLEGRIREKGLGFVLNEISAHTFRYKLSEIITARLNALESELKKKNIASAPVLRLVGGMSKAKNEAGWNQKVLRDILGSKNNVVIDLLIEGGILQEDGDTLRLFDPLFSEFARELYIEEPKREIEKREKYVEVSQKKANALIQSRSLLSLTTHLNWRSSYFHFNLKSRELVEHLDPKKDYWALSLWECYRNASTMISSELSWYDRIWTLEYRSQRYFDQKISALIKQKSAIEKEANQLLAVSANQKKNLADFWSISKEIGRGHLILGDVYSAIEYLESAIKTIKAWEYKEDIHVMMDLHNELGLSYSISGNKKMALECYAAAWKFFCQLPQPLQSESVGRIIQKNLDQPAS